MQSHVLRIQRKSYETMLLHWFLLLSVVIVTVPTNTHSKLSTTTWLSATLKSL